MPFFRVFMRFQIFPIFRMIYPTATPRIHGMPTLRIKTVFFGKAIFCDFQKKNNFQKTPFFGYWICGKTITLLFYDFNLHVSPHVQDINTHCPYQLKNWSFFKILEKKNLILDFLW